MVQSYQERRVRQEKVIMACNELLAELPTKIKYYAFKGREYCNYGIGYIYDNYGRTVRYSTERGYRTLKDLVQGVHEFIQHHTH